MRCIQFSVVLPVMYSHAFLQCFDAVARVTGDVVVLLMNPHLFLIGSEAVDRCFSSL